FKTSLDKRDNEPAGGDVMTHRRPVMAAGGTRAALDPLAEFLFEDILPVMRSPGCGIELIPDVLKDSFFVAKIFAGLPIQLPQDTVLSDSEEQALSGVVHQHAFKNDIEIE